MATRPRTSRPFRWTRAHLARLPRDGNRYEVLDGALLVTPQARYRHQRVAMILATSLDRYCTEHSVGRVVAPGAVVWDQNELQPDVQVMPVGFDETGDPEWTELPMPILVVEVLSSGSERHDRYRKRDAYLALGIAEYWIVDIDARTVSVFAAPTAAPTAEAAAEPAVVSGTLRWQPRSEVPALEIELSALLGR